MGLIAQATAFSIALVSAGCGIAKPSYPYLEVSSEDLRATVRFLTGIQPPRNHANVESMDKAADYIKRKMADYGIVPEEQVFQAQGKRYVNVIGTLGASQGPRVIVGAHYDVCGEGPGADDNASAVAGLLEIARLAKTHESELPYRVDFVAFALEEPPFFRTEQMGSYVHAKSLRDGKVEVKGMICLEMIGFFSEVEKSQKYPLGILRLFYPRVGNFVAVVGNLGSSSLVRNVARHMRAARMDVRTLKAPRFIPSVGLSDHWSFWKHGYDAVMITDTSFYRNPNYHRATDTMETLDFEKMGKVVKGVCWTVLNMK